MQKNSFERVASSLALMILEWEALRLQPPETPCTHEWSRSSSKIFVTQIVTHNKIHLIWMITQKSLRFLGYS